MRLHLIVVIRDSDLIVANAIVVNCELSSLWPEPLGSLLFDMLGSCLIAHCYIVSDEDIDIYVYV